MISQIFILSNRGDKLLKRDFRMEIAQNQEEIFFQSLLTTEAPIFEKNGVTYIFKKLPTLYVVAVTTKNTSPSFAVCALEKLITVLSDFLGGFDEERLRQNFILVYEIVDEFFDNGFPQLTNTIDVIFSLLKGRGTDRNSQPREKEDLGLGPVPEENGPHKVDAIEAI